MITDIWFIILLSCGELFKLTPIDKATFIMTSMLLSALSIIGIFTMIIAKQQNNTDNFCLLDFHYDVNDRKSAILDAILMAGIPLFSFPLFILSAVAIFGFSYSMVGLFHETCIFLITFVYIVISLWKAAIVICAKLHSVSTGYQII